MSTPSDDSPTVDDVMETQDVGAPHRDRTQHGGAGRIHDDTLDRLVEQERADVGVSDYDPDHIPPATDEPTDVDLTDTEEYQGELTEARRVARQDTGDFPPTR
jgi:hypothetical protein